MFSIDQYWSVDAESRIQHLAFGNYDREIILYYLPYLFVIHNPLILITCRYSQGGNGGKRREIGRGIIGLIRNSECCRELGRRG
jgi:hypothetical protein